MEQIYASSGLIASQVETLTPNSRSNFAINQNYKAKIRDENIAFLKASAGVEWLNRTFTRQKTDAKNKFIHI